MLKIIVVDDEELIRKGLVKVLSKTKFQVVGEAANGLEALELIRRHQPDVVITDVKMPQMDGVELVKELEQSFPGVKKIVISGFSEFDYVRETMRFGALDYLLKPVDDNQLISLLEKISSFIESDKKQRMIESNLQEKLNEGLPFLKEQFIFDLITTSKFSREEVEEKFSRYEIKINPGNYWVIIVSLDNYRWLCREAGVEAANSMCLKVKNCFEEVLAAYYEPLSCSIPGGQLYLISTPYEESQLRREALEAGLAALAANAPGIRVTVSYGPPGKDLLSLKECYQEAATLLRQRFYHEKPVVISGGATGKPSQNGEAKKDLFIEILNNLEHSLKNCLEVGNEGQIPQVFGELAAQFRRFQFDPLEVTKLLIEVYVRLQSSYPEFSKSLVELYGLEECYPKNLEAFDTLDCLVQYNTKLYTEVIKEIVEIRKKKDKRLVQIIKDYINEHYHEQISLSTLAEQIYLSPSYLSDLFKNQTGETITNYLTKVRMEKAKELLKDLQMKSYEIGEMVGYKDPAYFSKVFKKVVGVSPNEYRNIVTG
ncbi:MAG: response regulator transcription factor [Firmicutes bacterium]|nr:response regulator transcription factor [Bacillota bacterium]